MGPLTGLTFSPLAIRFAWYGVKGLWRMYKNRKERKRYERRMDTHARRVLGPFLETKTGSPPPTEQPQENQGGTPQLGKTLPGARLISTVCGCENFNITHYDGRTFIVCPHEKPQILTLDANGNPVLKPIGL